MKFNQISHEVYSLDDNVREAAQGSLNALDILVVGSQNDLRIENQKKIVLIYPTSRDVFYYLENVDNRRFKIAFGKDRLMISDTENPALGFHLHSSPAY